MSWFRGASRLGVVAAAAGGSVAGFLLGRDERRASVDASWTTGYTPSVKWDWNWDRDADSLVKPLKHKPDFNNNNNLTNASHFSNDINNNMIEAREEKLEKARATASRHLIFVRHGQYNLHASADQDRTLTRLGRDQAALTGERLKELGLPYSRFVYSTMTRATETANIIREKIGEVEEIDHCDLLREGAPVPPEPPLGRNCRQSFGSWHGNVDCTARLPGGITSSYLLRYADYTYFFHAVLCYSLRYADCYFLALVLWMAVVFLSTIVLARKEGCNTLPS